MYPDGAGLYLQVTRGLHDTPRRSWVLRYRTIGGKIREMGLGSALDVSLAEARCDADDARKLVRRGRDPIEERTYAAVNLRPMSLSDDRDVSSN